MNGIEGNDLGFDVPSNEGASSPSSGSAEQTQATPAATPAASTQPAPAAPAAPAAQAGSNPPPPRDPYSVTLSNDFGKALAELQRVHALPSRNPEEEQKKAAALAKIQPHVHALQQGAPLVCYTAHEQAKEMEVTNRALKEKRIQDEVRTNPLFRELYEEYQRVLGELNKLRTAKK